MEKLIALLKSWLEEDKERGVKNEGSSTPLQATNRAPKDKG